MKKILIMGLPGSGKTTLAVELKKKISATHFNADEVRANINKDLGFSVEDRVEQARRMGWLCDKVLESGSYVIADFVCPTPETRAMFGVGSANTFLVFVDRLKEGRFEDTNKLFVPPENPDLIVTSEGTPEYWATRIYDLVQQPQKSALNAAFTPSQLGVK